MILYWLPLALIILFLAFLIVFFKTDLFRRQKIRFIIMKNALMKNIKHLIHSALYIVRISALFKLIGYFIVFIVFLLGLVFFAIFIYNQYIVIFADFLGFKLSPIVFSLSSLTSMLFSRQTNPIYVVGFILGSALSAFMRPKLERFVEKVKTKRSVIYVFGSNKITEEFVRVMCEYGFGPLIALIAEKERPWMEDIKAFIDLLTLDDVEILYDETIYRRIGFQNALKILILVDDKNLSQHILLNVRKYNNTAEVILLSRNKPPLLDLVGSSIENIRIIDDIDITKRALIRTLSVGFMYADAVEVPVPKEYIGKTPKTLEDDFNNRIKVLGVKRRNQIVYPESFENGDLLILYLIDAKVLKEFLQLLPISPFETVSFISTDESDAQDDSNKSPG